MFVYRVSEETNRFDFSRIRIPTLGVFLNSHKVYLYIVFKLYFLALAFNFLITTTMISRNFAISLHSLSLEFPRHLPLLLPLSLSTCVIHIFNLITLRKQGTSPAQREPLRTFAAENCNKMMSNGNTSCSFMTQTCSLMEWQ